MSDFQKSKAYAAEHQLQWLYDNVVGETGNLVLHGITLQLEPERRYEDLEAVQAYLHSVWLNVAVTAEFGQFGQVFVRERKGDKAAHYKAGVIAINTKATAWASGSGWAMRELTVIHELAHHYAGTSCGHGPKFTDVFIRLVTILMGPQAGLALRIIFDTSGVK